MYLAKIRKQEINVIASLSEEIKKLIRYKEKNDYERIGKDIQTSLERDDPIPLHYFYEWKLAGTPGKATLSASFEEDLKISIINKHRDNILSLDQSDWVNFYVFREMHSDGYFRCYKLYDDLLTIIRDFFINIVCPTNVNLSKDHAFSNGSLSNKLPSKLPELIRFLKSKKKILLSLENKENSTKIENQIDKMSKSIRERMSSIMGLDDQKGGIKNKYSDLEIEKAVKAEVSLFQEKEKNRLKPTPIFDILLSDISEKLKNYSDKEIYSYAESLRLNTFRKKHIVEQVAHKFFSYVTEFYQSFNATDTHSENIKQDNPNPTPDPVVIKEKGKPGRTKKTLNGPLDIFRDKQNLASCLAILKHDFSSVNKNTHNILDNDGVFCSDAPIASIVYWLFLLEKYNIINKHVKNLEYYNILQCIIPNFNCSLSSFHKKSFVNCCQRYHEFFDQEMIKLSKTKKDSKK
jgi:hypothetical protein